MSQVNENQNVIIEPEKVSENVQIENKEENILNMNGDASTSSIDPIQGNEEKSLKNDKETNNIVNNDSAVEGICDDLNSKTDVEIPVQQIKEIEVI